MVCAAGVRAAESVASNLDLMTRLTSEVAGELYGKFSSSVGDRPVVVQPFASGEEYVFVGNVFTGELMRQGVRTLDAARTPASGGSGNAAFDSLQSSNGVAPSARPPGALVLKFQNTAFQLSYPDAYRSHVVGGRKIRRTATVRVFATLSDAESGEVLWAGEAQRSHEDEFDKDEAGRVENGNYAFVQPIMPSGGWGKYVEPVFVTGIVVGLIYLFFANQSGN
jgi:hypothetical protein